MTRSLNPIPIIFLSYLLPLFFLSAFFFCVLVHAVHFSQFIYCVLPLSLVIRTHDTFTQVCLRAIAAGCGGHMDCETAEEELAEGAPLRGCTSCQIS